MNRTGVGAFAILLSLLLSPAFDANAARLPNQAGDLSSARLKRKSIGHSIQKNNLGKEVKITASDIEGKSTYEGEVDGEKWSYQVAFSAPILKPGRARKS